MKTWVESSGVTFELHSLWFCSFRCCHYESFFVSDCITFLNLGQHEHTNEERMFCCLPIWKTWKRGCKNESRWIVYLLLRFSSGVYLFCFVVVPFEKERGEGEGVAHENARWLFGVRARLAHTKPAYTRTRPVGSEINDAPPFASSAGVFKWPPFRSLCRCAPSSAGKFRWKPLT